MDYAKNLKGFADKLVKDHFSSENEIKLKMEELNLVYTTDEIERLNRVLLALHPISEKIKCDQDQKEISH